MPATYKGLIDAGRGRELVNAFLVSKGVRKGTLIQNIDYSERNANGPITSKLVSDLCELFPSLQHVKTFEGVLLRLKSANNTPASKMNNSRNIGEALGYPCADEFDDVQAKRESEITHIVNFIVHFKGSVKPEQLIANLCLKPEKAVKAFTEMRRAAIEALATDPEMRKFVSHFEITTRPNRPQVYIIKKVTGTQALTEEDMDDIREGIYNLGFSDELVKFKFKNNRFHRGVIATILSFQLFDPMEPLYPITSLTESEQTAIESQTKLLERTLLQVLQNS